jgi:hypothetical protein
MLQTPLKTEVQIKLNKGLHHLAINPLTAATSLGVKRFRVLNTTINIKDLNED